MTAECEPRIAMVDPVQGRAAASHLELAGVGASK
jgi:hypothetical protein